MTDTTRKILIRAREILSDESNWTQDVLAMDSHGCKVEFDSPNATCWCLVGAMKKSSKELYGPCPAIYDAIKFIENEIGEYATDWNDHADRTHQDVINLLSDVIEKSS